MRPGLGGFGVVSGRRCPCRVLTLPSDRPTLRLRAAAALLVLAGTVVRWALLDGLKPWLAQPDQLAWQLLLEEGDLRLDQLLHCPHDAGTGLLALIALAMAPLAGDLPPLSLSALAWDTVVRGVQVACAWAIFGRRTALLFAVWTVLAVPMLLPWAGVNVGLHHAAGLWPFLVLWALAGEQPRWLLAGCLTGAAVVFSYNSLVLVGLLVAAGLLRQQLRSLISLLPVAVVGAGLAAFRSVADLGFRLEALRIWSVRSVEAHGLDTGVLLPGLWDLWVDILPAALFSGPVGGGDDGGLWVAGAMAGLGLGLWRRQTRWGAGLGALVIIGYSVLYAASPFSDLPQGHRDYFAYRHLSYVLPLLACLALHGFGRWPWAARGVLVGAVVASGWSMQPPVAAQQVHAEPVGWILGRKLGDQPQRLQVLAADSDGLLRGMGWGMSSALHRFGTEPPADAAVQLYDLVEDFDPLARPTVAAGIRRSFHADADPHLDPAWLDTFDQVSWIDGVELSGPQVVRQPGHIAMYGNGSVGIEVDGPSVLVLSGTPADGRGPEIEVEGRRVVIGEEPQVLHLAGEAPFVLRYQDDLIDAAGNDRGLFLWWVGRP